MREKEKEEEEEKKYVINEEVIYIRRVQSISSRTLPK